MKSAQTRILNMVEAHLVGKGFQTALATNWANTGAMLIYEENSPVAIGSVSYDFQSDTYKLSIRWKGKDIPSQPGRADYFDFYQKYEEKTDFWSVLNTVVKTLNPVSPPAPIKKTCHACRHQQAGPAPCEKCGSDEVWM